MVIAIAGAGNGGTTVAADLKLKGHTVYLLKTSHKPSENFTAIQENNNIVEIEENGDVRSARLDEVSTDLSLVSKADVVIIFVQTNYQESVTMLLSSYLRDGQIILMEPGYLSTAFILRYCPNKHLTVAEAESSPIDCRIVEPGKVHVLFRNVRNPIGIYPIHQKQAALRRLTPLGYNFTLTESILEAALHNPNLIVHTVGGIMSIPRIEYTSGKNYKMYREVFTPHIWSMVKALDNEKMTVLDALGYKKVPYVEACKYRNSSDDTQDAEAVFFHYAEHSSPNGPHIPDSRFITEDVPNGLVLLESLAHFLLTEVPVCTALINIASAACDRDFRKEGRTLQKLGLRTVRRITSDCLSEDMAS